MASMRRTQGVVGGRVVSGTRPARVVSGPQDVKRTSTESSMSVVVRVRGTADEARSVLATDGARGKQVAVSVDAAPLSSLHAPLSLGSQSNTRSRTYTFDHVFGPDADQGMVYQDAVSGVLDEVLLGYNCTVFAYGQTGTGKTYTMEGDLSSSTGTYASDAGVIPRTLFRLFHMLETKEEEFSVHMSFVELYNEELRDLLSSEAPAAQNTGLRMYEDKQRGVVLQGLEEIPLRNAEHGLRLLRRGSQKRHIAATRCNESSSRSHCVFSLLVLVKDRSARGEEVMRTGKLNLVDLAGSENIGRSGAENKRAREAGMINQSLLTLGRVINALVDKSSHIPYRESRLTRLLQDSLGGRTKTCIIATVSNDRTNMEETLSTLDYALRAKSIKNKPELNQRMTRAALVKDYVAEIDRLRADLVATREKNGVYVDKEHWDELQAERVTYAKLAEEQRRSSEVAQSKLASMHEQLAHNAHLLARRDTEMAHAESLHKARIEALEASFAQVTQLTGALQRETTLHNARARNEKRLHEIALSLQRVVDESTRDVDALFAKLARRSDAEKEARTMLGTYYEQIEAVSADLAARAAKLDQVASVRAASSAALLDNLVQRIDTERAELRAAIGAQLEALVVRLAEQVPAADAAVLSARFASARTQIASEVDEHFCTLHDAHADEMQEFAREMDDHTALVHARLGDAVRICTAFTEHVRAQAEPLETGLAALQQHTRSSAEREWQRTTEQNELLQRLLHVEKDKTGELRRSLLHVLDGFEGEREKRFEQAMHATQSHYSATKRSLHEHGVGQETCVGALRALHVALCDQATETRNALPDTPLDARPASLVHEHISAHAARLDECALQLKQDASLDALEADVYASAQSLVASANAQSGELAAHAVDEVRAALERHALASRAQEATTCDADLAAFRDEASAALHAASGHMQVLEKSFVPFLGARFLAASVSGDTPQKHAYAVPTLVEPVPSDRDST
ncbi:Cin8p [Malassezia vespertilionis]|uniref:Kinesin-like protein n=1 Tax=Malassezia vespertilionis TaxID=2020962 RepID=A0A2N1JG02_9BASI|nr:Cin8p [Malassezia vespertilionis]